ncbi:MAG: hypothetical protein ACYCZ6_05180 [Polaromonas sp.]
MPLPSAPTHKPNNEGNRQTRSKADTRLLLQGIVCALIGLGMAVSPRFITSPGMQGVVTTAARVGWGVLALGGALIGWYVWRRMVSPAKP